MRGTWSVRLAAILTALMGIINVLSGVTPAEAGRFRLLTSWAPRLLVRSGHIASGIDRRMRENFWTRTHCAKCEV